MAAAAQHTSHTPFVKQCTAPGCQYEEFYQNTTNKTAAVMMCVCQTTLCEFHAKSHNCSREPLTARSGKESPDDASKTTKMFQSVRPNEE